ncbi:MAG TPA: phenylalanine--tRNA ligase subunit beta [Deferrisomatales bacterium]|nr:phenylalanine--tRNA ligase subunit beta [Deferrisomatales bacterium]
MRISLNWLRDYVDLRADADELAHRLTMAGLEVSAVETLGVGIEGVVTARIVEKGPHPGADRLSLCRVDDGTEIHEIVCGATNMQAGDAVALARVGTRLPGGLKIKKAKIRGQASSGMMCSERELGLGDGHDGILILPPDTAPGRPVVEVLGLPDTVFEVDLTPNRADCLSVVGVAREVAALTGAALRLPQPNLAESGEPIAGQTSVTIEDPELCRRYAARIVRGVRIGPSPRWLQQRLQAVGVRALNNVVDVTNYVLMELGHPLHAFDLQRLGGQRIVVRRARDGELFTTLDGQERCLDADTLMICDGDGPVAVAGIMGGLNSEVEDTTRDVLLESAYFDPANIRRSSKALGLSTEASYRFERGTDIEGLIRALDRAAELIAELAGGTVAAGIWDAFPGPRARRRVTCRPARVSAVLGVELSRDAIVNYLQALGLSAVAETGSETTFEVPPHRVDLEREIDLIEEVARLHGYDAIPTTLPKVAMTAGERPAARRTADRARDVLVAAGLTEAINLSFIDPAEDERLALGADDALRRKVVIQNPLNSETAVLRTTLLPGLLRAAGLNNRRQTGAVRLFEVGRTFHPVDGQELPREVQRVGAVLAGEQCPLGWLASAQTVDFFDAKGVVEGFVATLGVDGLGWETVTDRPWLHPGRGAVLVLGGEELGWCGQLHPDRAEAYQVPEPLFVFELDLDRLQQGSRKPGAFLGLDRYPAVARDLAVVLDRGVPVQQVLDAVADCRGREPLLRSATLFDIYEGERLAADKVSLAIRVVYRSEERTLTEEEVQRAEAGVLTHLEQQLGARLRGR